MIHNSANTQSPGVRVSAGVASSIALLIVALTGLVYWWTLAEGVSWAGGDYASYIWNAENILSGRAIGEAPFIPNYEARTGVTVVPPMYPLALSAPIAAFGTDIQLLKLYSIGFLLLFLLLIFLYARGFIGNAALLMLPVLAASPQLWGMRDTLLSEYFFLFLLIASFLAWDRLYAAKQGHTDQRWLAVTLTLVIALMLTRVVAVVLVPALLFAGVWAERRLSFKTLVLTAAAAGAFAYLVFSIGIFEQYGTAYSQETQATALGEIEEPEGVLQAVVSGVGQIPERARLSLGQVTALWTKGIQRDPTHATGIARSYQRLVTVAVLLLGALGFGLKALRGLTLAEWFTAGYTAMMLLVPPYMASGRVFLPISVMLIFYAFYAFYALYRIGERPSWSRLARPAQAALAAALLASASLSLASLGGARPYLASAHPKTQAFFEAVKRQVPEQAVMVGYRPRGVAFFTGRAATDYHQTSADADYWARMDALGAEYLYFDVYDHRAKPRDGETRPEALRRYVSEFLGDDREQLTLLFENDHFMLYARR